MTSAVAIWILRGQPTLTLIALLAKLCLPSLHLSDLMELLMWILLNSKPTLFHTQGSTSLLKLMHLSSVLRKPTTSNSLLVKSPMPALSLPIRWLNAILVMASTWLAACSIVEMLFPKMSMLQLLPSRPREPSSLLIGAQLDLRLESTTNHQLWYQAEISQRFRGLSPCYQTLPQ